jgi:hypothetical protein
MLHENELIIKKARCLAKEIIALSKSNKVDKCYELDDIVQEARYLEFETRELDDSCKSS